MKRLLILIYFLPFILFSCRDKERPIRYIDQETKDYCVFKEGSWWAYREETSGLTDTITIRKYEYSIESWKDAYSFDFELITMYTIWSSYGFDLSKQNPFLRLNNIYRYPGTMVEEQYPYGIFLPTYIFYPIDSVLKIAKTPYSNEIRFEKYYDSITIEGKKYYDVKEISTNCDADSKNQKRIFWAKNIGRIRYETFADKIWNLTNHHVIQ